MSLSAPVDVLSVHALGRIGDQLGSGGQAFVHELPDLRLPDAPGSLVYKCYRSGKEPPASPMHQLIGRRMDLTSAQRDRLDTLTTWPLRAVVDNGRLRGVVMARIPDPFLQQTILPSGQLRTVVREVQHLFVPAERCHRIGMPVPGHEDRLRVCRDFAAALDFLHAEVGVVFGDVSACNEVFRPDAAPMVMLIDCDAARRCGAIGTQLNTPDWEPVDASHQSRYTDCYKLGLFVLRCLTPGPGCSTDRDPGRVSGVLDDEGLDLMRRALTRSWSGRPSAHEWWRYLSRCLGEMIELPELVSVSADRTLVAAGEALSVRWAARHGQVVEVASSTGVLAVADCDGESGSVEVVPPRTGRLVVTVRNNLGAASGRTEPVAVLDPLPREHLPVPVPRPPAAGWAGGPLPELWRALPPPPGVLIDPVSRSAPWAPSQSPPPASVAAPGFAVADCPIDIAAFLREVPDLTPPNREDEQ